MNNGTNQDKNEGKSQETQIYKVLFEYVYFLNHSLAGTNA